MVIRLVIASVSGREQERPPLRWLKRERERGKIRTEKSEVRGKGKIGFW